MEGDFDYYDIIYGDPPGWWFGPERVEDGSPEYSP